MMSPDEIAESVVIRTRNGDQNADALIVETFKAAQIPGEEGEQARLQLAAIHAYIEKNPVPETEAGFGNISGDVAGFGAETLETLGELKYAMTAPRASEDDELDALFACCSALLRLSDDPNPATQKVSEVILAQGVPLNKERLGGMQHAFRSDLQGIYRGAIKSREPLLAFAGDVNAEIHATLFAGEIVRNARDIQIVSRDPSAIRRIYPRVAAELES